MKPEQQVCTNMCPWDSDGSLKTRKVSHWPRTLANQFPPLPALEIQVGSTIPVFSVCFLGTEFSSFCVHTKLSPHSG